MDISMGKKSTSDVGASTETNSEFGQIDRNEDDDPISAYFKQRCKGSSVYFKRKCKGTSEIYSEDRNSSIGLIDIDCVSLFDAEEENEVKNFRFSDQSFDQTNKNSASVRHKKESDDEVESELDKQRALAQKALKRLSSKTNELFNLTSEKRESTALSDISDKLLNVKPKPIEGNSLEKEWLQPNFSPKTPRHFNDELSSLGGECENLPVEVGTSAVSKTRQSLYAKKINSMLKELTLASVNSDMKFESLTEEEQINRFEEDEKKFKLESSSLPHNSQISRFSGIAGDLAQWQAGTSKPETENKNLSIGEFFNMRSHRISSLVGSGDVNFELNSKKETEASTLSVHAKAQQICKSECSLSACDETPELDKPKVRRCVSTNDLKPAPEVPNSKAKCSRDSSSRNSTLFVQEILAEMQPGLSGAEIYENIMKAYKKRKEVKESPLLGKMDKSKKTSETGETPKSSIKNQKRKDACRKKIATLPEACKESKIPPDRNSILCTSGKEKNEKKPICGVKENANTPSARNYKKKELGASKGFYSSTPKNQDVKSQNKNYRKNCGKNVITNEDWEPPRVNLIKTIEMSKCEYGEENEKTILVTSSGFSEVNKKDTFTVEDTILAGDLTVISQRIEEMKRDSVCIVRSAESQEPVLLTVVQKLASLPKGSLDCSALTPLLRDEFPELLSNFPFSSLAEPSASDDHQKTNEKGGHDALVDLPGSWVKLPAVWGLNEKIYACADVEKTIIVPFVNISQKWLLASIRCLEMVHPLGKKLSGERKDLEWFVKDFAMISLKETIIPPDNRQSLKVSFKSEVATKLELMITFEIKELIGGEVQTRHLRLLVNNVHPENYINVLPSDAINFGVIADQCFDQTVVQVTFDGICELPLMVYIEEDEPRTGHFTLKPCSDHPHEKGWNDGIYHHKFFEGEKQILEFRVDFRPNVLLKADSETQDFKAFLILMIGSKTDSDGILKKIPINGSVGFARFLCKSPRGPLLFNASEKGQSVTRLYPLKNVGSLSIEFSVSITNEDHKIVEGEDMFVVPKSFCLPRNEEAGISVTFNAYGNQSLSKRYLTLQLKPNGRNIYETELIGIVATSEYCKPLSPTSGVSVSTKSTANSESVPVPVKLLTTTQSLSWAAVALEKESRLNFQIKSLSAATTSVRISFERNLDAFKLVNENGEKVQKLRKVLKPDSPCVLTVIFRPDVVGAHNTCLTFEAGRSCHKKRVLLNGIGGTPNLLMKNAKSDLTGCKILTLQHSRASNQFENVIEFTNEGRIPAFVILKRLVNDFSLSHDLEIVPSSFVIHPDSSVSVKISQKLRNEDLQQLLSDREIHKIATLCVLSGDEPSRLRIRKLVESGKLQLSERLRLFTGAFSYEKGIQLRHFKDSPAFESEFLKSLKVHEVAVVVEKNAEIFEPSILEETTDEFFSFISDRTVIPRIKSERQAKAESCKGPQISASSNTVVEIDTSPFSVESLKATCSHNLVTKWLETLDCI